MGRCLGCLGAQIHTGRCLGCLGAQGRCLGCLGAQIHTPVGRCLGCLGAQIHTPVGPRQPPRGQLHSRLARRRCRRARKEKSKRKTIDVSNSALASAHAYSSLRKALNVKAQLLRRLGGRKPAAALATVPEPEVEVEVEVEVGAEVGAEGDEGSATATPRMDDSGTTSEWTTTTSAGGGEDCHEYDSLVAGGFRLAVVRFLSDTFSDTLEPNTVGEEAPAAKAAAAKGRKPPMLMVGSAHGTAQLDNISKAMAAEAADEAEEAGTPEAAKSKSPPALVVPAHGAPHPDRTCLPNQECSARNYPRVLRKGETTRQVGLRWYWATGTRRARGARRR